MDLGNGLWPSRWPRPPCSHHRSTHQVRVISITPDHAWLRSARKGDEVRVEQDQFRRSLLLVYCTLHLAKVRGSPRQLLPLAVEDQGLSQGLPLPSLEPS